MTDEFVLTETVDLPPVEAFPDGTILPAEVAKVEVKTAPFTDDDGNPVKQVEFVFELPGHTTTLEDGRVFTRKVYGKTSTTFSTSEKCRLRAWVQEIMSVDELPAGYRLELGDLVGNPCRVILKWKQYQDKKSPIQADGTYRMKQINEVQDVLRAAPTGATQATPSTSAFPAPAPSFDEEPF